MSDRRGIAMLFGVLGLVVACGDDDGGGEDGGAGGDGAAICTRASDCNDGMFCNGAESCDPAASGADARGCVSGAAPCEGACDDDADRCLEGCVDADGDGFEDAACGGEDCDDDDPDRYPGNTEVCDAMGHDEDCDPDTLGPDRDGDGYVSDECCNGDVCGADCDDGDGGISPDVLDGCGGGDEDCDGSFDEDPNEIVYRDRDGDGYGTPDETLEACGAPMGYAPLDTDCNDDLRSINPGAAEVCDGGTDPTMSDENCDGTIDEGCGCTPVGAERVCGETMAIRDGVGRCAPGAQTCQTVAGGTAWSGCAGAVGPIEEVCNDEDDDCDGAIDEDFECRNGATDTGLNDCGREGTRTCLSCTWTPPDFSRDETAATCDYCDDTGRGSLDTEISLSIGNDTEHRFYREDVPSVDELQTFGAPSIPLCSSSTSQCAVPNNSTVAGASRTGAVYLREPVEIGYEGVTFEAKVTVFEDRDTPQEHGWGLVVVLEDDTNPSPLLGAVGEMGVPRGRDGMAVEWWWYDFEAAGDVDDTVALRQLRASGADPVVSRTTERAEPHAFQTTRGSRPRQHLRARITPDNPVTTTNETEVVVQYQYMGLWQRAAACGAGGEPDCGFAITSGATYHFGIVSSATSTSTPYISFRTDDSSETLPAPSVNVETLCP